VVVEDLGSSCEGERDPIGMDAAVKGGKRQTEDRVTADHHPLARALIGHRDPSSATPDLVFRDADSRDACVDDDAATKEAGDAVRVDPDVAQERLGISN
jgi:hypothetical protein